MEKLSDEERALPLSLINDACEKWGTVNIANDGVSINVTYGQHIPSHDFALALHNFLKMDDNDDDDDDEIFNLVDLHLYMLGGRWK
ncbi:hypothetical protein Tco_0207065 [Tanacetum coccineum]